MKLNIEHLFLWGVNIFLPLRGGVNVFHPPGGSQIASSKFGTSLGVMSGLSGALSHPGSVSPCHS